MPTQAKIPPPTSAQTNDALTVDTSQPGGVGWKASSGLPSGGTVGQVVTNTAPGTGTWQDAGTSGQVDSVLAAAYSGAIPMDGSNINFTSPAALLVGSDLELIESVPASGNFDTIQILTDGLYVVQIQADLDQIATTDGTVDIELNNNGDGTTAPLLSFADNDVRYPLRPTAGTTTVELRNAFAPVFLAGRCKPGVQLNVGVKSNLKAGTLVGHAVDIIVQCQGHF